MTKKTTRREQYSDLRGTLYLAFELGLKEWKLGFSIGLGQKARRRTIPGGDLDKLKREIAAAKKRFQLSETAPVVKKCESIPIPALEGRNRTAQGVSPGVRHGKPGSALKGRRRVPRPFRARSMPLGVFPRLTPWAVLLDPFRVPSSVSCPASRFLLSDHDSHF